MTLLHRRPIRASRTVRRGLVGVGVVALAVAGIATAAPADAIPPLHPSILDVNGACKVPGKSADAANAYYISVTLYPELPSETFTFESFTVAGTALTTITPNVVQATGHLVTVTLRVDGAANSAGAGILHATLRDATGGSRIGESIAVNNIAPVQSPKCSVPSLG